MNPILRVMGDVQAVLMRDNLAETYGFDPNDLANALRRDLNDKRVTDTAGLIRWANGLLGRVGIGIVCNNLHLKVKPSDSDEIRIEKWFSYRGVDEAPQPQVWPDELADKLKEMAQQAAAEPEKFDALQFMGGRVAILLRYTLLFYASELRKNGRFSLPGEDGPRVAEMLEELSLSELCGLLTCDVPLRARPYDPAWETMIVLSDEAACASLSRLADLAGEVSTLSPNQTREFSACLLAILGAWHGDDPYTAKACTVEEVRGGRFGSKLTCYDEMGRMITLKGVGAPVSYGSDVLVRTADKGDIWAPELQVVPEAEAWKTPDVGSRKGRAAKLPERDQVFISYSHDDHRWLKELQKHLWPYITNSKIDVWDDTKIDAGAVWRDRIKQALDSARVAVLLVTPDFLASKFITQEELPPLLEAAESKGVTILWVPVRSSSFEQTPIEAYQAVHPPESPLASMTPAARDKAFVEICKRIQQEYER
jgi:hypothetical protein